ncbi:MAG: hypothetical protein ABIH59_02335 [archaeon]
MNQEYHGQYLSSGFIFNRINFPSKLRRIFYQRVGLSRKLYCSQENDEGVNFLSLWETSGNEKRTRVKIDRINGRLQFPKKIKPLEGSLIWLGVNDHIEIFNSKDWNEIKNNTIYEKMLERIHPNPNS